MSTGWFQNVVAWIRRDWKRFAWELVAAGVLAAVGWLVGYLLNSRTLQACQDERAELLRLNAQNQAAIDSVKYSGLLAQKDHQISLKDEQIIALREKMAADSIQHLSELAAMRAINRYVDRRPGEARPLRRTGGDAPR